MFDRSLTMTKKKKAANVRRYKKIRPFYGSLYDDDDHDISPAKGK